jgi:hypothetical protein
LGRDAIAEKFAPWVLEQVVGWQHLVAMRVNTIWGISIILFHVVIKGSFCYFYLNGGFG